MITIVDVTSLTLAEARQAVLIAELQHRTRNLLAVVQAIAKQTLGKGGPLEPFLSRLSALGRVQSLISHATREQVDLAEIIRIELHALGAIEDGRITVSGPPVSLNLERVQTVALALHELITNALKHGALRQPEGRLEIVWRIDPAGSCLVLDWRETGISITQPPVRRGYGRELIERALSFALKARTELLFGQEGVSCRIELPLVP